MNVHVAATPVVTVQGLSIAFDDSVVLEDVGFSLGAGEVTVLVGPSGAGKSTLLHAVAGVVPPTRGVVQIVARRPSAKNFGRGRDIGFVFQDPLLFPWRTIRRNVELGLEGLGFGGAERRERANNMLALVGLSDQADKWPHQLSGGQRQRAGLARALVVEPTLLLMDEPFAALDPKNRASLQGELLAIVAQQHVSVLFVTHDMSEAVYLADRILVMGQRPATIIADLRLEDARPRLRNGQHPLVAHLYETFGLKTQEETA